MVERIQACVLQSWSLKHRFTTEVRSPSAWTAFKAS